MMRLLAVLVLLVFPATMARADAPHLPGYVWGKVLLPDGTPRLTTPVVHLVNVYNPWAPVLDTNAGPDGDYVFPWVPAGTYIVCCKWVSPWKNIYYGQRGPFDLAEGGTCYVVVILEPK